jgi:hypothetical protein
MLFWNRKPEDGIVGNYADALRRIKELEVQNNDLKRANDAYQSRLEGEMANASFAIDWDAMKAFSVERNWDHGIPRTIIGYMLSEPAVHTEGEGGEPRVTYKDVVREWTLHCSAERHEELVKEFTAWRSAKK